MDKDMRKLTKALEAQGFTVEITKRQHLVVTRDGRFVAAFAGTPSDWRGFRNSLAALRRHGFRWPNS